MYSAGHLIWIVISFAVIVVSFIYCMKKRPDLDRVLRACLIVGIASEIIKILSVANILPMVEPVFSTTSGGVVQEYAATGQYTPYIELAHMPFELCSLQIVFIFAALCARNDLINSVSSRK